MSLRIELLRWSGRAVLAAAAAVIALHIFNAIRLDVFALSDNVEAVVDRAEALSRQALPEYQDLALARLPPSPINGDFYRFDDNLQSAKVTGRSDTLSDDVGQFAFQLEFDETPEPDLVPVNGRSTVEKRDGHLVVTHRDDDYLVNSKPVEIPRSSTSDMIIRARANKGNRFTLLWAGEGRESEIRNNKLDLDLVADGEFHTYIVNVQDAFRRGVGMKQNISVLGIAPSNVEGAVVEIDYVRLVSKLWKYEREGTGTSYESVDGELRPVLHMISNQRLEYVVAVPNERPKMTFGMAALVDRPPINASVSIMRDTGTTQVFTTSSPASDHWQDEELDLSPWAGETVRVVFDVQSTGKNVVFWSNPTLRAAQPRRFNVILVLEDALRADHLSTQDYKRETSPEKTRLMNERGIVFTNAHSQATKTRPSVASLMTSLYPTATGVWTFSDRLSDRYFTLAEVMRSQGFVTGAFLQNGNAGPYAGNHQGFNSLREAETIGKSTLDIFGDRTLAWLEENRDRNFFLYLHSIDPHGIYDPPAPYDRWYREADPETLVGEKQLSFADSIDPEWAKLPSAEARRLLYDGEIAHNDAVIGRFVEELDERGVLDNTLLIFISDHGEWLGERGLWEHHPPGNRPVIHVPLMVVYPTLFKEPARIEESVQLVDVMPTILELAEVDSSHLLLHGDSLVALMQGTDLDRWRKRVTVSEEPVAMERAEPCACGSVFFDQWQLHGSDRGWPRPLRSEFVKTAVYRFREDGIVPVTSFLPDLSIRILRARALSRIQSANITLWRTITEGEAGDIYKMDPDTLEELRGLGYVN